MLTALFGYSYSNSILSLHYFRFIIKIVATGSSTTVYTVEEKGDPNETLPENTETERQFLIKWTGWSHLHNTWESLETLQEMKVKGLKKLDNFCKVCSTPWNGRLGLVRLVSGNYYKSQLFIMSFQKEEDHSRWKFHATVEDVEYLECQLELQQELVKCYVKAERIIGKCNFRKGFS